MPGWPRASPHRSAALPRQAFTRAKRVLLLEVSRAGKCLTKQKAQALLHPRLDSVRCGIVWEHLVRSGWIKPEAVF